MKLDHAAAMAAKEKSMNDSQLRHSEALQREREKRDRGIAVQNDQHLVALGNLGRKLDREWHTVTCELKKQLGTVQLQLVQCEKWRERGARHAKEKDEESSLLIMSLRNDILVVAFLQFLLQIFNFMICFFLLLFSLPLARQRSIRWTNLSNRSETQIIKLKCCNNKYAGGLTLGQDVRTSWICPKFRARMMEPPSMMCVKNCCC